MKFYVSYNIPGTPRCLLECAIIDVQNKVQAERDWTKLVGYRGQIFVEPSELFRVPDDLQSKSNKELLELYG